ncbi:MAG: hypothetical protein JW896_17045, partial [Deltaproteobacteria bacterium]|nr:hypothetical protein [Deltaproteobacteria bacterium]
DAGADEPAEALCEGGSCSGNHGFTRGAPLFCHHNPLVIMSNSRILQFEARVKRNLDLYCSLDASKNK